MWVLWFLILAVLASVPAAAYVGYKVGRRYPQAALWDPLWIRAYGNRPIDPNGPHEGFWLAGYYVDYDRASLEMVRHTAEQMDQIVIFGYGLEKDGTVTGRDQEIIRGVTGPTKRVLLFANLTNGAFSQEVAHAILTDPAAQEKAIRGILGKCSMLGVAGVQIDFENIAASDRAAFTAFLKKLKQALSEQDLTLSVAVPAKTWDETTGWGGATDYAALGQIADQLYIMAYDEHFRGSEPGPIASLKWTEQVIRYATGKIPAQKIVLGVPFYGYEWTADPKGDPKTNRAYGVQALAQRVADAKGTVKWDAAAGENVATYKTDEGERIAWYPDQRSIEAKLKLAYQYNLKGVSLWRLGFEPEEWWEEMGNFRLHPTK